MNLKSGIVALFCVACLVSVQCQKAEKYTAQNSCTSKTTCSECMQTKSCEWCFQRQFDGPRCYDPARTADGRGGCPEEFTMNVDNLLTFPAEDGYTAGGGAIAGEAGIYTGQGMQEAGAAAAGRNFGFVGKNAQGSASHLAQRAELKLRMNTAYKLNFVYSQAEDYPVDLYYIMDLSKSMENDKNKLSALGDLLATTMRKTTSNFRLGFGSFVDKVVMPYVSTVPKNLNEPCSGCAAPYGFMNDMPLSTDTHRFSEAVRDARVSGNLDSPEGGFDAIMQAVVCQQIGWRTNARRLLVFSTDASFHYAGDGKLGGIVQPNDGLCHLDSKGYYSYSTIQDYPSISQINLKVQQNAINLIFAVTADQYGVYEQLRQRIEGASCGVLSNHSENVVQFIEEQYNKISSAVEIKDNSSSAVQIKYFSSCLGDGPPIETNKCDGLKVGDKVQFTAEILVRECPKNREEWNQLIRIYPVAVGEQLLIDLQMICECDCERPGNDNFEANSNVCHMHGDMTCGVCRCHEPYFGRHCECPTDNRGRVTDLHGLTGCRPGNLTTGPECSGRGTCICGECQCTNTGDESQEISGPFCECDNFSCDRHKGVLCSGPEHGECGCYGCVCKPGWTGAACDCAVSEDTCRVSPDEPVCSGHGQCKCGVCVCDVTDDGHYSGRYCDQCPTCPGRCQEFRDCVRCQVYQDGPLAESGECAANCTAFVPYVVDKVIKNETLDESLCTYSNEEDCWYSYVYSFDEKNRPVVRAQKEPDCPPQVFILGIVLGVIAAIVLVGLALLMLWKMVTTIHDRREFARFEKERMMAKWDTGENPIYKQATSTFKNPTYAGK